MRIPWNVAHGYNSGDFIEHFPQLLLPFQKYSSDTTHLYLELEHDFAARDLVINMADRLSKKIKVMTIFVNCDRGIMDANRIEKYCISPLLKDSYSDSIIDKLRFLNRFVKKTVFSLLNKFLKSDGYIVDIHSMWPFNINIPSDAKSDIEKFVKVFLSADHKGSRRKINFINNELSGKPIGFTKLAHSIEEELALEEYPVEYNNPYYMLPIRSNYQYLNRYKGVVIDIPRDFLGIPRDSTEVDFSYMKKDMRLISKLSYLLTIGILKYKNSC